MKEASHKRANIVWFHLYAMSSGQWEMIAKENIAFGGEDENVLKVNSGDGCTILWIY